MLTLKSLTVLPIAASVGALFFLPFYQKPESYAALLAGYLPAFNWRIVTFDFATLRFSFDFEFAFVFQWPTNLALEFQIPMIISFGLLLFDYSSRMVWLLYKASKGGCCFEFKEKHFKWLAWTVTIPLKAAPPSPPPDSIAHAGVTWKSTYAGSDISCFAVQRWS